MTEEEIIFFSKGIAIFASLTFGCAGLAIIIRLWVKLNCRKFESDMRLEGKTVLITGANGGIGKEAAKDLAKRGARVIMACRTMKTANEARDEIIKESNNKSVIVHHLDLSSFQSIRDFAAVINKTEPKLDILIHNAGCLSAFTKAVSVDGIEMTMATNHYGPFLLTHLLIDLLRKTPKSRIVVVSSKTHTLSFMDPTKKNHLNPINLFFPFILYGNSKFANILFTFELARRLEDSKITVNCLHPGVVNTAIARDVWSLFTIVGKLFQMTICTVQEGIQTILFCALSPELENVSGKYFRNCREGTPDKGVHSREWQSVLWEESRKIVKLSDDDPQI